MAKVSKITGEMIAKGKGIIDYYMLRGIIPVARSWPKRRETPFRPRELEAQGVFGILSKNTTFMQDKVKEAWIVESIGKRPRWQDTYIGLGMKYWGINKEIPPILIDYQIHWHTPNPELELLLQKIEKKYGKTEAQEIQTTGIVDIKDIEAYRQKLYFSLYDTKGIRIIAPFLEFIIGKSIDFSIKLQELAGFIEEPLELCITQARVRIPKGKTYYYHGVLYECVTEPNPKPAKCFTIERKETLPYHEWELIGVEKCGSLRYVWASTYNEARDAIEANEEPIYMVGAAIGQFDDYSPESPWHSYFIYRAGFQFKTNQLYLPPGAPIQYAAIRVKRYETVHPLVIDFNVVIQNGQPEFPHDPMVKSDYCKVFYSGNGGSILASELKIGEFTDIQLSREGRNWVNLGGYTKLMLRSSRDIEGIEPVKAEEEERIMLWTDNGNEYDPRLIIRIELRIPKVKTGEVIHIYNDRAMIKAEITFSGYWYNIYGFHFKEGLEGTIERYIAGGEGWREWEYAKMIWGLKSDTKYYYQGFIENNRGKSTGKWKSFRTLE